MVLKTFLTLALASGFAAAKPINNPQTLPTYPMKRQISGLFDALSNDDDNNDRGRGRDRGNGDKNNDFSFIDGFNNVRDQQAIVQVNEQNLVIVNDGNQQAIVQQVSQVLVVQNEDDGFNRDLNNLFRKSNARRERNDKATVMLVVQQIQVSVQDDRGNAVQQDVFVQSAVVANRGARETVTVMMFESKTIIAADVLNNDRNRDNRDRDGKVQGVAGATDAGALLPTKTAEYQILGAKPTWSAVVEDPAASLGAVWQAELEDLQKGNQDQADNQLNADAAAQEKAAAEQAKAEEEKKAQEAAQQGQDQQAQDQAAQDQQKADEAAQQVQEQQAEDPAAADAAKAEEEKKAQEAQQQQDQQAQEQQPSEAAAPATPAVLYGITRRI